MSDNDNKPSPSPDFDLQIDGSGVSSLVPPVFRTANFSFPDIDSARKALGDERNSWLYTRGNNPTTNLACRKIADLEGTDEALLFASGMAAISAGILHFAKQGCHIVCVENPYSWTRWLFSEWLPKFGVSVTYIPGLDAEEFRKVSKENTVLYYLESPNSFTFNMQDLSAVTSIAESQGIATMIDNSYASPLFQQPANFGVDLIAHSASKYLSGHSDIIAGVLCGSKTLMTSIFSTTFQGLGGIISPADSWLLLRGLQTLPVRMERIAATAHELVHWMENIDAVQHVFYPFHKSHPQFELAQKQMKSGAGQFTIQLATENQKAVEQFCNALQQFKIAVSWGGCESLVLPAIAVRKTSHHPGLIRFCAGLEPPDVLKADIMQALEAAGLS